MTQRREDLTFLTCLARKQLHNEMQPCQHFNRMSSADSSRARMHMVTANQLTIVHFMCCRPMLRVHRRAQASVGRLAEASRLLAALLQDAAAIWCGMSRCRCMSASLMYEQIPQSVQGFYTTQRVADSRAGDMAAHNIVTPLALAAQQLAQPDSRFTHQRQAAACPQRPLRRPQQRCSSSGSCGLD